MSLWENSVFFGVTISILVTQEEIFDFRRTMDQSVCLSIIERGAFDLPEVERVLSEKT